MAVVNKNSFVFVGNVTSIEDNDFNGNKYKQFEVMASENEKGYFSCLSENFPPEIKFLSQVEVVGMLRGSAKAKTSPKGVPYVATQNTAVVLNLKLIV